MTGNGRGLMSEFERLARGFEDASDEATRLQLAVDAAVELIGGCDHAGITVHEKRLCVTRAASDEVVRRATELQGELGEGPCLDTSRAEETLVSRDLAADPRWPRWAPKVHDELGVGSMVAVLLHTKDQSFGALSVYGDRRDAFEPDDLAVAQVLAGHLAVSIAAARTIDQLGVAVVSRTVIGQAEGILMERLGIDAEQAFAYLRRVASHHNVKLARLAADLVRTRRLPLDDADG